MLKSDSSQRWHVGKFELVSAGTLLKERTIGSSSRRDRLEFKNVVGDVRSLHLKYASSPGGGVTAIIQAASQFNCLEMVGPSVTPESGITQYIRDRTQGPGQPRNCVQKGRLTHEVVSLTSSFAPGATCSLRPVVSRRNFI